MNIKEKLNSIIEHADCDRPACKNCISYKNGGCTFGCLNEQVRLTTPNYSCDNFKPVYEFKEDTLENLKELLEKVKKAEEGMKNLELLLTNKINEDDFNDMID